MKAIGDKKTFRYQCNFCLQELDVCYSDLKPVLFTFGELYKFKCPDCGRKIHISDIELRVIRNIQKREAYK